MSNHLKDLDQLIIWWDHVLSWLDHLGFWARGVRVARIAWEQDQIIQWLAILKVNVCSFGYFSKDAPNCPHIDFCIIFDFVKNNLWWSVPPSCYKLGQLSVLSSLSLLSLIKKFISDLFLSIPRHAKRRLGTSGVEAHNFVLTLHFLVGIHVFLFTRNELLLLRHGPG